MQKQSLKAVLIGLKKTEQNSIIQQAERVLVNGKFSHIFRCYRIHGIQQRML